MSKNSERARLGSNKISGYSESGYVALIDLRFDWTRNEIRAFETMWREGLSVDTIAGVLKRDPDEVVILVIDRARKRKIKPRKEGLIVKH